MNSTKKNTNQFLLSLRVASLKMGMALFAGWLIVMPFVIYADHMPLHKHIQVYQNLTQKPLPAEYEGHRNREIRYRQYYQQQFRDYPAQLSHQQLELAELIVKQQEAYQELHYRHSQQLKAVTQESQERYKKVLEQTHLTNQRLKASQRNYLNDKIKLRGQGK